MFDANSQRQIKNAFLKTGFNKIIQPSNLHVSDCKQNETFVLFSYSYF